MKFNLNNEITVTLTERGQQLLRESGKENLIAHLRNGNKITGQAWAIFRIFGKSFTGISSDSAIDMNIELHEPNP